MTTEKRGGNHDDDDSWQCEMVDIVAGLMKWGCFQR